LEVAVQVALIREACRCRHRGDAFAGLEQTAGHAQPVGKLERVRRQSCAIANQSYQPELANPGDGGEFLQAHVALRLFGKVLECAARAALSRSRNVRRGRREAAARPTSFSSH
jgi:hypothetical protein